MLRNLLLIVATALAAIVARADVKALYPATYHNFGAFSEESGPATCRFTVVNMGPDSLVILSARATCGCTQPSYPLDPIAAGDTAYISVTYNPQGRPGRFEKYVYVNTNASVPKVKLEIAGVVIGAPTTVARRFPAQFGNLQMEHNAFMMGEVLKGETKTVYLNGYNRSSDTLTMSVVRQPRWLETSIAPHPAPAGENMTIVGFINSSKCDLYGLVEDTITMRDNLGAVYSLPLTLLVNEDFSTLTPEQVANAPSAHLSADAIDFGNAVQAPASAKLTLTNTGRSTLAVRRIYSGDPGIEASAQSYSIKPGKPTEITVTLTPGAKRTNLLNSRLTIIVNDPMNPTRTVRLVGEWK